MTNQTRWPALVGIHNINPTCNIDSKLDQVLSNGLDFVCCPFLRPNISIDDATANGYIKADSLLIKGTQNTNRVVPELEIDKVLEAKEKSYELLIDYLEHIGFPVILFKYNLNNGKSIVEICRVLSKACHALKFVQIWLCLEGAKEDDIWLKWGHIRESSSTFNNLNIVLDLPEKISVTPWADRWVSEPVKLIRISEKSWLKNDKDFPVLPKNHQFIIQKFIKLHANVLFNATDKSVTDKDSKALYVKHLIETTPETWEDAITNGYEDVLQIPLQPLSDNLDLRTYQVFKDDETKYKLYENAIELAFNERLAKIDLKSNEDLVVFILGAGSLMPLGECVLKVAKNLDVMKKLRLVILDKNPNSLTRLEELINSAPTTLVKEYMASKERDIEIVFSDIRSFKPGFKADLVVSELLGSFGDNELCPECLHDIEHLFKSERDGPAFQTGACIPYASKSFIAPIQSPLLYSRVNDLAKLKNETCYLETPFVVYLQKVYLVAEPKSVWEFSYPSSKLDDFEQKAKIDFEYKDSGWIHGFSGYFECSLFKDVLLSTNPQTQTPNMLSWFPMFFPALDAVFVESGSIVSVFMWRKHDPTKKLVWIEWAFEVKNEAGSMVYCSKVHNLRGLSSSIKL